MWQKHQKKITGSLLPPLEDIAARYLSKVRNIIPCNTVYYCIYLFIYCFYYLFVTFLVHITYILNITTMLFFWRHHGSCYLSFIVCSANNDNRGIKELNSVFVLIWDSVSSQCEFYNHTPFEVLPLPSSPFMNPIVIFSVVLEGL